MQWSELLRAGCMNVSKKQHVLESIFAPTVVAAAPLELFRILEGAEHHVPNRNVREVVCVMANLMMNPMGFRPLEDESKPRGRFDVPMIKKFSERDENCVIARGSNAAAEQGIHNQAAQDRIDPDFDGMFVEAGHDFQPTG